MIRLRILCAGGFALEILWYARESISDAEICEPESINSLEALSVGVRDQFVIACGDTSNRAKLAEWVRFRGGRLRTVKHPTAQIAPSAKIGDGSVLCPFSFVGPNATVSANVVLNVHAACGHDAVIGADSVCSPYSFVAGGANVSDQVFLGSYAFVAPLLSVGHQSKVAAGAVVTRDVPGFSLATGNPATSRQVYLKGPQP